MRTGHQHEQSINHCGENTASTPATTSSASGRIYFTTTTSTPVASVPNRTESFISTPIATPLCDISQSVDNRLLYAAPIPRRTLMNTDTATTDSTVYTTSIGQRIRPGSPVLSAFLPTRVHTYRQARMRWPAIPLNTRAR